MSPDEVPASEIVWAVANRAAEAGEGRAEGFAAAVNALWQRMGANRYMSVEQARRYMRVEEARLRGIEPVTLGAEAKPTQVENELRVLRETTGLEPTPRPARDSLLSEHLTDPIAAEVVQQVVKQKKSLYLDPIFAEPPPGVSKPLWEAYAKQLDRQHEAILTKAVELATKWHRERQTTEWKANAAEMRKDVEVDIRWDPAYAADRYFNGKERGTFPSGRKNPDFKPMAEQRSDD